MKTIKWQTPKSLNDKIEEVGLGWAYWGMIIDTEIPESQPEHRFTLYYHNDKDEIFLRDYKTGEEHLMDYPGIGGGQRAAQRILDKEEGITNQTDENKIVRENLNFIS